MGKFGENQNKLDYKKVLEKLNSCKKPSAKQPEFDSLKSNLENLFKSFKELNQEEKNHELNSNNFQNIWNSCKTLEFENKKIVSEIQSIVKKMLDQKELSQDEKIDKIYQNINTINKTLERLEKEDIEVQGKAIQDIATSTDKIDTLETSIKVIKTDISKIPKEKATLNPIEKKISNLENSLHKIVSKIDTIKFPELPKPPKIPTDYLKKDDFEFELNNKFNELKDLKELAENLEIVPAKVTNIEKGIQELSQKLDNLPNQNSSSSNSSNILKEEKAVINLAQYMKDGVTQFENIAKEYVSKIQELEKFEKAKAKHKEELEKVKREAIIEGKKEGQISLIKEISEKFPSSFDEIKSLFEEYLTEKFKKDEEIDITNKNQNDKMPFIEGEISLGKYKILTPAILLDDKIIIKSKVEEIKEKENQDG